MNQKCGMAGIGGKLLRHQWRCGCCCVHGGAVGTSASVVSVEVEGAVVVGRVDEGVNDGLVVREGADVDGRVVVVAGVPPPPPLARMARP